MVRKFFNITKEKNVNYVQVKKLYILLHSHRKPGFAKMPWKRKLGGGKRMGWYDFKWEGLKQKVALVHV
jgi:hypothetical protein